ncbi:GNAT family N-acetyltransferase [Denitrobaculum tricleocarpae]|nr:GNAT family N-acetyltransferase [Denitrobaculum tricleocarpae]
MQLSQNELQDQPPPHAAAQGVDDLDQENAAMDPVGMMLVRSFRDADQPGRVTLSLPAGVESGATPFPAPHLLRMIERTFIDLPESDAIELAPGLLERTLHSDHDLALVSVSAAGKTVSFERKAFFQSAAPWLHCRPSSCMPLTSVTEMGKIRHPQRPPEPRGLVYERYDPVIDMTISFRAIDPARDLETFYSWMNDGRVAFFWELAQSEEELAAYLETLRKDPHAFGLIGSFDGDPFGYFEVYWAKEDRLGSYYDADDYDRGWHGLVGNRRHLGHAKTLAWLRALTHYLFIDDLRSRKVVGEPRASHTKLLRYADDVAYYKVKEFDFPHKRSALMQCDRETFFETVRL